MQKRVGPDIIPQHQLPLCIDDGRVLIQPMAILQRRMVKVNIAVVVKVLVQWSNLSLEEVMWGDWGTLGVNFPIFSANSDLEDNVIFAREGIVMSEPRSNWKPYC